MRPETLKRVGENLRILRTVHKLSQDEIAEYIGTCRSMYTHYELGNRTPDPEALFIITNKLGIEMSALFETDHEKFINILASSIVLTEDSRRLVQLYNDMSPYHKGVMMERAEILTEIAAKEAAKKKAIAAKVFD